MNQETIITESFEDTEKIGESFAKKLKPGDVVCLYGDLGAGKTTFVKGLARGLGIRGRIISPTFILIRTYKLNNGNFYHVDLYRIEDEKDLEGLGLKEMIDNSKNIVVIEWAEKMGKLLPINRIEIYFESLDEDKRRITIKEL